MRFRLRPQAQLRVFGNESVDGRIICLNVCDIQIQEAVDVVRTSCAIELDLVSSEVFKELVLVAVLELAALGSADAHKVLLSDSHYSVISGYRSRLDYASGLGEYSVNVSAAYDSDRCCRHYLVVVICRVNDEKNFSNIAALAGIAVNRKCSQ